MRNKIIEADETAYPTGNHKGRACTEAFKDRGLKSLIIGGISSSAKLVDGVHRNLLGFRSSKIKALTHTTSKALSGRTLLAPQIAVNCPNAKGGTSVILARMKMVSHFGAEFAR